MLYFKILRFGHFSIYPLTQIKFNNYGTELIKIVTVVFVLKPLNPLCKTNRVCQPFSDICVYCVII